MLRCFVVAHSTGQYVPEGLPMGYRDACAIAPNDHMGNSPEHNASQADNLEVEGKALEDTRMPTWLPLRRAGRTQGASSS